MKVSILKQELQDAFEKGYMGATDKLHVSELPHAQQVILHKRAQAYADQRVNKLTPVDTEI